MSETRNTKQTITARQLGIILLIAIFGMRLILLPSVLAQKAGTAGYLSFIVAAGATFAMIAIAVYIISKNAGKTFLEILENYFGKIAGKAVVFLVMFFFVYKIILADFEMEGFLFEVLYENLNWNYFIIPVFILMGYVAFKGPRVLGRSGELFFIFSIAAVAVMLFQAVPNMTIEYTMPFFSKGFNGFLGGAITGFTLGGEFLFLLIFCENITKEEVPKLKKNVYFYSLLALIIIAVFIFIFVTVFGETAPFIKDSLTKISQFSPTYKTSARLDGFVVAAWLPVVLIYSILSIYCAAWCFKNLLNIKSFTAPITFIVFIVLAVRLIPSLSPDNFIKTTSGWFAVVSGILQILLPVAIAIATAIKHKGGKNEQKQK